MTPDFFYEKSKTDLGFEIGQPQRKCQRRTTLQSTANPAVYTRRLKFTRNQGFDYKLKHIIRTKIVQKEIQNKKQL